MGRIRLHPDPILRQVCPPVDVFDAGLAALAAEMIGDMYEAPGRGLAAPQIGDLHRMFVMDADWKSSGVKVPHVLVNPEITWTSDQKALFSEGCLSIPGVTRTVCRPAEVELAWQDLDGREMEGRFSGLEAVIAQHELDHLNGILILDHPEVSE